jgi:hypothetical protein
MPLMSINLTPLMIWKMLTTLITGWMMLIVFFVKKAFGALLILQFLDYLETPYLLIAG